MLGLTLVLVYKVEKRYFSVMSVNLRVSMFFCFPTSEMKFMIINFALNFETGLNFKKFRFLDTSANSDWIPTAYEHISSCSRDQLCTYISVVEQKKKTKKFIKREAGLKSTA